MAAPVTEIRNIGPAMAKAFARAGIGDAETLRDLGADSAYARLIEAGTRPHFIGYYALVMGLQGRPWTDCKGTEKDALRARFHALVAGSTAAPVSGIEAEIDRIGVRP